MQPLEQRLMLSAPEVSFSLSQATIEEGQRITSVQLLRTGVLDDPLTVDIQSSGSATPGADLVTPFGEELPGVSFEPSGSIGQVTFLPGEAAISFTIDAVYDGITEAAESRTFTILDTAAYDVTQPTLILDVENHDNTPPLAVADAFDVIHNQTLGSSVTTNDTDADTVAVAAFAVTGANAAKFNQTYIDTGELWLGRALYRGATDDSAYLEWNDFELAWTITDAHGSDPWNWTYAAWVWPEPTDPPPSDWYAWDGSNISVSEAVVGDPITASLVSDVQHGSLSFDPDGSFTYTPDTDYLGSDSFTYQLNDTYDDGNVATVTIDVTNAAPIAAGGTFDVTHDRKLTAQVTGNDTDGDAFTFALDSDAAHGDLTFNPDGSFTYLPDALFAGVDSFTYYLNDGFADGAPATVTIDVTNIVPVAADDIYAIAHDRMLSITDGVMENDVDVDGPADGFTVAGAGIAAVNQDYEQVGLLHGRPKFQGLTDDSFFIEWNDWEYAWVITQHGENIMPWEYFYGYWDWENPHDTPPLDGWFTGYLGSGSSPMLSVYEPPNNPIHVTLIDDAQHGSLSLNADGSFDYTPDLAYVGVDSFTYLINDGIDDGNVATVTLDITNAQPASADDAYTVTQNTVFAVVDPALGVLANDHDDDADALAITVIDDVQHGSLSINANGTFTYTPTTDYVGSDSFTYQLDDGITTSAIATVTFDVIANGPPIAGDDTYAVPHNTELNITDLAQSLLANDADPDGNPLTINVIDAPAHGALSINADGTFTYAPGNGFAGLDSFTYQLSDGALVSNLATVTIDITNALPLSADETYTIAHDTPVTGNVLTNDTDADSVGEGIEIIGAGEARFNQVYVDTGEQWGGKPLYRGITDDTLYLEWNDFDWAWVLTSYHGSDPWAYEYGNWSGNTAAPSETGWYIGPFGDYMGAEPTAQTVTLGDVLTAELVDGPTHGSITLAPDGSFTYTPDASYVGADSFTYRAHDGYQFGQPATVTIDITDGTPVAIDDVYTVRHDRDLTLGAAAGLIANDFDADGDVLSALLVDDVQFGSLSLNADGSLVYTPDNNFAGVDTFTYRAVDGAIESNLATVTITVTNDPPVGDSESYDVHHTQMLSIIDPAQGLLAGDVDPDASLGDFAVSGAGDARFNQYYVQVGDHLGRPLYQGVSDTAIYIEWNDYEWSWVMTADHGGNPWQYAYMSWTFDAQPSTGGWYLGYEGVGPAPTVTIPPQPDTLSAVLATDALHGMVSLQPDGTFTYTPDGDFAGTDTFSYQPFDGIALGDEVTVTIDVTNVAPTAADDAYTTAAYSPLTVTEAAVGILGNDTDADGDALAAQLVDAPVHGDLTLNTDGTFTYAPHAGFSGIDTFTYTATDGAADTAITTVTISVEGNTPPVAQDDAYELLVNAIATGQVLTNDTDADNHALTANLVDDVQHGSLTLSSDGSFTYTPEADFVGQDTFTYQPYDGFDAGAAVTVTFTVRDNAAPIADDQAYEVSHDTTLAITDPALGIFAGDSDPDGDAFTGALVDDVQHGTLTLSADGTFTYIPDEGFVGLDTFTYQLSDPWVTGNLATVTLSVTNAAPTADDETYHLYNTPAGATLTIADAAMGVLVGDSDADGDAITATLISNPAHGQLTFNPDGTFTYAADPGYDGLDSFTYAAVDFASTGAPATVTIDVALNTAPVPTDALFTLAHDTSIEGNVTGIDAEGDAFVAALVADVAHGVLSFSADGSFQYTPDSNYVGSDSFTFELNDGISAPGAMGVVAIDVVNVAPVGASDSYSVLHDTLLSVGSENSTLLNDADADGDAFTAVLSQSPSHGTLVFNADGSFDYTPDADYFGLDAFTYRAVDAWDESADITVQIEVRESDPPMPMDDAYVTSHGLPLVILDPGFGLLANDVEPDDDVMAASLETAPAHGSVTINADGTFTYTPTGDYVGFDSFTYLASDLAGYNQSATVSIELANDAPTAPAPMTITVMAGVVTPISDSVLTGAADPDGDVLTATLSEAPQHGAVTLHADGTFVYVADHAFAGTDTFAFEIADPFGGVVTSHANVESVDNVQPFAATDAYVVWADQPFIAQRSVLVNDIDLDGESLSLALLQAPSSGQLIFNADGTFTYTPDAGFVGVDGFTYTLSDAWQSGVGTVVLDVIDSPPIAIADQYRIAHDRPLEVDALQGVLANDQEVVVDAMAAAVVTDVSHGSLTLAGDGSFIYTPDANFVGSDTFTYQILGALNPSEPTAVTIEVTNRAPVAHDAAMVIAHDTTLAVTDFQDGLVGLGYDLDGDVLSVDIIESTYAGTFVLNPDGTFTYQPHSGYVGLDTVTFRLTDGVLYSTEQQLQIVVVNTLPVIDPPTYEVIHSQPLVGSVLNGATDPQGDTLTIWTDWLGTTDHGELDLQTDGTFTYTPMAGFVGEDTFTFFMSDGIKMETIAATITVTNDVPVSTTDAYVVQHGQTLEVAAAQGVGANDFDGDASDSLVFAVMSQPQHGSLSFSADGGFTYTADMNYAGEDTFTYIVSDGVVTLSPQMVSIDVQNIAPHAAAETYTLTFGSSLVTSAEEGVLANDYDRDDILLAVLIDDAIHGSLTLSGDGSFTYTPDAGFVGTDHFSYRADDGQATSAITTVQIDVVNHAPSGFDDFYDLPRNAVFDVDAAEGVLANDIDPDANPLTAVLVDSVAFGNLVFNGDGSFTYTPDADFVGLDTFTYQVTDGNATTESYTVQLSITNGAPVAVEDTYAVDEDAILIGASVLANDADAEGDTMEAVLQGDTWYGTLTFESDGTFTYEPDADFFGSDSFVYAVTDGDLIGESVVVTIDVAAVNDAPVLEALSAEVHADDALTASLLTEVYDADGDALTVTLDAAPTHGSVLIESDGSYTYTPDVGYIGDDSFTVVVSDGTVASDPVLISLAVVNDAPVLIHLTLNTYQGSTVSASGSTGLLAYADDDGAGDLVVTLASGPSHGTLTLNADGSFTYTADAGYVGVDGFTYVVTDSGGASSTGSLDFSITASPFVVSGESYQTTRGETYAASAQLGVLRNDWHIDDVPITVELVTGAAHGIVTLSADGAFTYMPEANHVGNDAFTYRVTDGVGYSSDVTATIDVTNAPPDVSHAGTVYTVGHDRTLEMEAALGVLVGAYDEDGDGIQAVLVSQPEHGQLLLNADGSFSYTPDAQYVGSDSFTITATDGIATSDEVTIDIEVTNVAPFAGDNHVRVHYGNATTIETNVTGDDFDFDGDIVVASIVSGVSHGSLTLTSEGLASYTPDADFVGIDSFTYVLNDGAEDSAVATVSFEVWNNVPWLLPDEYSVAHGQTLNGGVAGNDMDPDGDGLTYALLDSNGNAISADENGDMSLVVDAGELKFTGSGSFTFVSNSYDAEVGEFVSVGMQHFRYRVSDGGPEAVDSTLSINVTNEVPHAIPDLLVVATGVEETSTVAGNDWDGDGDTLYFELVDGPSHGSLTNDIEASGSFTYTADEGYAGLDTFTYRAHDGVMWSEPVSVTLSVRAETVYAVKDIYNTMHAQLLTVGGSGILGNDIRPAEGVQLTLVEAPEHGTVTLDEESDGAFTYLPDEGFTGLDTFTYRIEAQGFSSEATASIVVEGLLIYAMDDRVEVNYTQEAIFDAGTLRGNDFGVSEDAVFTLVEDTPHGNLSLEADGSFTYEPDGEHVGPVTFTYQVEQGGNSSTALATIILINEEPVGETDTVSAFEDTEAVWAFDLLLGNDTDFEGDVEGLALEWLPQFGTLTVDGENNLRYMPLENFYGTDSFTYRPVDERGLAGDVVMVSIDVAAVDDAPVAHGVTLWVLEGHAASFDVLDYITDVDGYGESPVVDVIAGMYGEATVNGTVVTFTAESAHLYDQDFFYTFEDEFGNTVLGSVDVHVGVFNESPIAVNDSVVSNQYAAGVVVSANDIDPDSSLSSGIRYVEVLGATGDDWVWYEASSNSVIVLAGEDRDTTNVTYRVSDDQFASDVGALTVEFTELPNRGPIAHYGMIGVKMPDDLEGPFSVGLSSDWFEDPDGDELSIISVDVPAEIPGSVSGEDMTLTFYPDPEFDVYVPIATAVISDGRGGITYAAVQLYMDYVVDPDEPTEVILEAGQSFSSTKHNLHVGNNSDQQVTINLAGGKLTATGSDEGSYELSVSELFPGMAYIDQDFPDRWNGSIVWEGGSGYLGINAYVGTISSLDFNGGASLWSANSMTNQTYAASALYLTSEQDITGVTANALTVDLDAQQGEIRNVKVNGTLLALDAGSVDSLTVDGDAHHMDSTDWAGSILVEGNLDVLNSERFDNVTLKVDGHLDYFQTSLMRSGRITAGSIRQMEVTNGNMTGTYKVDGAFNQITVAGSVEASVTAGSIGTISAGLDVDGSLRAEYIGTITAIRDIHASVTATTGNIGDITAGRDITGSFAATTDMGHIAAGRLISGLFDGGSGNIASVAAGASWSHLDTRDGRIEDAIILADGAIGSITVVADLGYDGSITSTVIEGDTIASVAAHGAIDGVQITAQDSVGDINAGEWLGGGIHGSVTALNGSIGHVTAHGGDLDAALKAQGNINHVFARGSILANITSTAGSIASVKTQEGDISGGDIHAGTYMGSITAAAGEITSNIKAAGSISNITAGQSIRGSVTSLSGNIGNVTAGVASGGDILAAITATGGSIGSVQAHATAPYNASHTLEEGGELFHMLTFGDPVPEKTELLRIRDLQITGGNIAGDITAGASVGSVTAAGSISAVSAGTTLGSVWAGSGVGGDVSAGVGGIAITSWGAIAGDVTGSEQITLKAYDAILGDVASSHGNISAITWSNLNASIDAHGDIDIWVYQSIAAPHITSTRGGVTLHARQNVAAEITSHDDITVRTYGDVNAEAITSSNGGIDIYAWGAIDVTQVGGKQNVVLAAHDKVEVIVMAGGASAVKTWDRFKGAVTAEDDVSIQAIGEVKTPNPDPEDPENIPAIQSTSGNVSVVGELISAVIIGGAIDVIGWSDAGVNIEAEEGVNVWVHGTLAGTITSSMNDVTIYTSAGMAATIEAAADVTIESGAGIGGDISTNGALNLRAYSSVSSNLATDKDIFIITSGDISSLVDTTSAKAVLVALGNITSDVTAGESITMQAGGSISSAEVISGGWVSMAAIEDIAGSISAVGNVAISSEKNVTTNINSSSGGVYIDALGVVSSDIVASQAVTISAANAQGQTIVSTNDEVEISAFEDISGVNVTAKTAAHLSAGNAVSGAQIHTTGGALSRIGVYGLTTVSATLDGSGAAVNVFAGTDANISTLAQTQVKSLQVTALGDSGLNVRVEDRVDIHAWGSATGSVVTTASGSRINVIAGESVAGAFTSVASTSVIAMTHINGASLGGQTVTATAMGNVNTTITAAHGANVKALGRIHGADVDGYINGSITTTSSGATLLARGDINAVVTTGASGPAKITSLDGSVIGEVTAGDNAEIVVAGNIQGDVTAAGNIDMTVGENVFSTIKATNGSVNATILGNQTGSITAGSTAKIFANVIGADITAAAALTVLAGSSISGGIKLKSQNQGVTIDALGPTGADVNAKMDVAIYSRGDISGEIVSLNSNVSIESGGGIGGDISAAQNIHLTAIDDLSGTVSAIADVYATVLGSATSTVNAGNDIDLWVGGAVTSSAVVESGRDTKVTSADSISGAIDAGRNAEVSAMFSVDGTVDTVGAADVFARDSITGDVTAGTDAIVNAWGSIDNVVSAGEFAAVLSVGSLNADVTAGTSVYVDAFATADVTIDAGEDVIVTAFDELTAVIDAGRDVAVTGDKDVTATIHATGSVYVTSLDTVSGLIETGIDASVVTIGDLLADVLAGQDASVITFGDIAGSTINASGFADVRATGLFANAFIHGEAGAFLYTSGMFTGTLTSGGSVAAMLADDASFTALQSGGDMSIIAVANVYAFMDVGGTASVLAVGAIDGMISSGDDIYAISFSSIQSILNSGADIYAIAQGDIAPVEIDAAGNVSLVAFGNLAPTVTAGGNIELLWGRGGISGSYVAGNAIKQVGSFSAINASFVAGNQSNTGESDFGHINAVEAWGAVAGSFDASVAIDGIRSGDVITASVTAPTIGALQEHDHYLVADYPVVSTSAAAIEAQLAVMRRDIVLSKRQIIEGQAGIVRYRAADLNAKQADTVLSMQALAAGAAISGMRIEYGAFNADAEVARIRAGAADTFIIARHGVRHGVDVIQAGNAELHQEARDRRDRIGNGMAISHAEATQDAKAISQWAEAGRDAAAGGAALESVVLGQARDNRADGLDGPKEEDYWDLLPSNIRNAVIETAEYVNAWANRHLQQHELEKRMGPVTGLNPESSVIVAMSLAARISGAVLDGFTAYDNAIATGQSVSTALTHGIAVGVGTVTLRDFYEAWTDEDTLTGEKFHRSAWERIGVGLLSIVNTGFVVFGAARGISNVSAKFRRSVPTSPCFLGDNDVLTGPQEMFTAVIDADPSGHPREWRTAHLFAAAMFGVAAVSHHVDRRRRGRLIPVDEAGQPISPRRMQFQRLLYSRPTLRPVELAV